MVSPRRSGMPKRVRRASGHDQHVAAQRASLRPAWRDRSTSARSPALDQSGKLRQLGDIAGYDDSSALLKYNLKLAQIFALDCALPRSCPTRGCVDTGIG